MKHYIPAKEADFVDWSGNLITVSKANKTPWNLPENQLTPPGGSVRAEQFTE
ncbi:MAG: hypothetical protein LBG24_07830 [Treponema sp.]|jgi:hypothetical protein|nr:hypothetical protein [Treponema sp.]